MNQSFKDSLKEAFLFAKTIKKYPRQIGAFAPSSSYLAKAMAKEALKNTGDGYFLEIGAGTGRLTKALLDAGVSKEKMICIELDQSLCDYLTDRFPGVHVIKGNACYASSFIDGDKKIEAVVSGIPMRNIHCITKKAIIESCFSILKPGGKFVQFTYGPFSSIDEKALKLNKRKIALVLRNFPPASIWSYTMRSA